MKKIFLVVGMILLGQGVLMAAERGTPEYEKIKEYKKSQKAKKEAEKLNPPSKEKGFWQKEAERSGFAGTGAMFSNSVGRVLPFDAPNSRKKAE